MIRNQTNFQVGHYCGEMGQDFWDARRWQREFESKQVAFSASFFTQALIVFMNRFLKFKVFFSLYFLLCRF